MVEQSRTYKVFALSFGKVLTSGVAIITSIVAARVLSMHDYATMRQTMLAYYFVAPLLTLALPDALYYFLPTETSQKRGILIDNLVILSLMGAVFCLFLLLGGNKLLAIRFNNPDLEKTLRWMVLYPVFALPASIIGTVMVVQNRVTGLTIYNVISRSILALSVIVGCFVTRSYTGPILAQIMFSVVTLPIILWLSFSSVPGQMRIPDFTSMLAMVKYSIPLGCSFMLTTITFQLDKVIVSSMCAPEEFAIYANGAIEIPLIGVVTGSIAMVILAEMTVCCQNGDNSAALSLFNKAAVHSALILFPIMAFLMVFANDFIVALYSDRYIASAVPFRIYLLILPIRVVVYGTALMALGLTKTILWRSLGDFVVNICLTIFFVYLLGYIGAAIATVITFYTWHVPFNIKMISKGFKCKESEVLPFKKLSIIMLSSWGTALIVSTILYFQGLNHFLRLLIGSVLFLAIYTYCVKRYLPDFNEIYNNITRKIFGALLTSNN